MKTKQKTTLKEGLKIYKKLAFDHKGGGGGGVGNKTNLPILFLIFF